MHFLDCILDSTMINSSGSLWHHQVVCSSSSIAFSTIRCHREHLCAISQGGRQYFVCWEPPKSVARTGNQGWLFEDDCFGVASSHIYRQLTEAWKARFTVCWAINTLNWKKQIKIATNLYTGDKNRCKCKNSCNGFSSASLQKYLGKFIGHRCVLSNADCIVIGENNVGGDTWCSRMHSARSSLGGKCENSHQASGLFNVHKIHIRSTIVQ